MRRGAPFGERVVAVTATKAHDGAREPTLGLDVLLLLDLGLGSLCARETKVRTRGRAGTRGEEGRRTGHGARLRLGDDGLVLFDGHGAGCLELDGIGVEA